MTRIEVFGGRLRVEVLGWHKLWAFTSGFEIPLEHVVEVRRLEEESWFRGIRMGGTGWPGVIKAGRYLEEGEWIFWDVCRMSEAVVIRLRDESYAELRVETEDAEETIRAVRAAMR